MKGRVAVLLEAMWHIVSLYAGVPGCEGAQALEPVLADD